jgi:hypothetical protein
MSDAKTPKKAETVSKKNELTKTDVAKTEKVNTETKAVENSVSTSTSHFSSVSTPQYRSGWNNIFGGESDVGKIVSNGVSKNDFPKKLNILDYDIDLILRDALDVAFNEVAKKRGINLSGAEELVRFEYSLSCEIKEK